MLKDFIVAETSSILQIIRKFLVVRLNENAIHHINEYPWSQA